MQNVNHVYNRFLEIFTEIYDIAFPKKNLTIKQKTLSSPWITKGLQKFSRWKQLFDRHLKKRTKQTKEEYEL